MSADLVRVRCELAYDGSGFSGFARNAGVRTVAGELEAHLERVLRAPVQVTAAGRTDSGVHARGQVISFDAPADRLDPVRLRRSLNSVLGPEIAVRAVAVVDDSFDARFSARARTYHYTILRTEAPDPFLAATTWHLADSLDLDAMRRAGTDLVGQHDFSSFCRRPPALADGSPASLERTVLAIDWAERHEPAELLVCEIRAVAFCHQMVRSIVGTLVDVGLGRLHAGDVRRIMLARDRATAGPVAPPQGLVLWEVGY